ncbi:MAG: GNAT family N-acetyltransferase [Woeseiaceae bacterium]
MSEPALTARFHSSMSNIDATDWDALVGQDSPHLRHAFLKNAETSGSVAESTGWLPCHLTLENNDKIIAAMPLYQKGHSWGEFVFDWAWADAYQRSGLDYYPKLISAAPYTPATTSKLLVNEQHGGPVLRQTLLEAAIEFAQQHQFSSLHLQFLDDLDLAAVREREDLLIRKDCQFHWENHQYQDFDDYLSHFSSKKRKNVKRERRRLLEAGIQHRIESGREISAETLDRAWQLCSYTFLLRGHSPYLNQAFFHQLLADDPDALTLVLATHNDDIVAAAILLRGRNTLLGRYWGSDGDYHSLHFETCYYQGIEYCIREGIRHFEPGTQGEHKVSRGFLPANTWSAHWLAHPQFASAIGNYLEREADGVDAYMNEINQRSPFKSTKERRS